MGCQQRSASSMRALFDGISLRYRACIADSTTYNRAMELAVLFMLALFAFVAWAPKELTQAALALAWGGAALSVVATLIYGLGRLLFA